MRCYCAIAVVYFLAAPAAAQPEAAPVPDAATFAGDPSDSSQPQPESPPTTPIVESQPEPQGPLPVASLDTAAVLNTGSTAESETGSSSDPLSTLRIHGFVSEGGFVSTANQYIGRSTRGSLAFFEAGINVSLEPTERLRAGGQLIFRKVGTLSEDALRVDWAVLDYRIFPWLGLRGGIIKMPLGLYNEYVDIDAARTSILMPQSVYPIRNRDALISHMGFAIYGTLNLVGAGEIDYQVWLGTLSIPRSALELSGASLVEVDTEYVAGVQLFWRPPLDGLRVGGSYLRAAIDFSLLLDPGTLSQLVASGMVAQDYDGRILISQNPTSFWVGSAEFMRGDWLFAAEYSRWLKYQKASLALIPTLDEDAERLYGLVTYRMSTYFEVGTYYAVTHADVSDRTGRSARFVRAFQAFQRDLAVSLRFDVNRYWLWKLEAHYIDGVAELQSTQNPDPTRRWGLFLFRTTVTF